MWLDCCTSCPPISEWNLFRMIFWWQHLLFFQPTPSSSTASWTSPSSSAKALSIPLHSASSRRYFLELPIWLAIRLAQGLSHHSLGVSVAAITALGFLFQPIRRVVERFVDKLFGKSRYEYAKALREVGETISNQKEITKALPIVCAQVADIVGAKRAEVIFVGDSQPSP